jgi:hypothetical protein
LRLGLRGLRLRTASIDLFLLVVGLALILVPVLVVARGSMSVPVHDVPDSAFPLPVAGAAVPVLGTRDCALSDSRRLDLGKHRLARHARAVDAAQAVEAV